ncbi:hypothetical protein F8M41_003456 [Gigaspora margarita]|uniref:Uncharacterized protein n=1 Tax=Gigaspora margarita TaxID=4874 RepID=A0A8H4AY22_GIGMA|nr:hypothetical protein F8M41_003456 [Gigaspora margarita]
MSKGGVQPIPSWNNKDEVIKRGRVALVKKENRLCIVDIIELVTSRHYKEYTKLKTKIGNEEEIFDNSEEDKKFAIFDNNIGALPDLIGIEFYLKKLIYILDAMFHDIELSKKSQMPIQEQIKGGKQEISPQDIKYKIYGPQSRERSNLREDYKHIFKEIMLFYRVRFDILIDKEERALVKEVQNANFFLMLEKTEELILE